MAVMSKPAAQRQEWVGDRRLKCRLRGILEGRGVSQRKLCIETGLSSTTVKSLFHDSAHRYDGDTLIVLMAYLEVSIEDLLEVVVTPGAA